jgi:hypothetical protein
VEKRNGRCRRLHAFKHFERTHFVILESQEGVMGSCAACIYGFKPHLHPLFIFSLLAFLLRHASMGDFNIHDADGSALWRCFPDTHLHISLPVISLSLTHLPLCVC